ncbi:MAG TPA: murein biosynthesis integral membrane protein MurJ [Gammaproteobacteria bacterium]|nr:murein biosynthesis integral membrane protein MurJ [Gammaproteobacteria bacterium]
MARSLLRSTSVVGGMTLLSRVLGFARDIIFAHSFGAGLVMDAFFVAFKIPNFMRRMFAEGAFSQAFVPVLGEVRAEGGDAAVREFVARITGTLSLIVGVITVIGIVAAPILIYVFAAGFAADPDKYALSVAMLRLTFPYLLFISLTALAGGVLNTYGRFGVPAFTPVILNILLIGAAIGLAPMLPNPGMALAWGVLIAGIVQLAFQFPFLWRLRLLPRPRLPRGHPAVRRTLRLMLPALFGSSASQFNLLIDNLIASFLATGSVSWLYYSDRLMEFPLGVFAIALATVILPGLSAHHAKRAGEAFSATIDWALRLVLVVVLPAAVGLFMLAGPLIATLFRYGEFSAYDVRMAHWSLMAYAFGLMGFTLVKVLAPGFYARQDVRTPVRVGVIAVCANIALNGAITAPMALLGFRAPHAGLALATSLAAFVNAGLLFRGLRRKGIYRAASGWAALAIRVAIANGAMAAVLAVGVGPLSLWLGWAGLERAWHLALWIGVAVVVYFAVLLLSGLRPRHLKAEDSGLRTQD